MTTAPDMGPQGSAPDTTTSSADPPAPPPMPIPANPHFSISIHDLVESARSDHGLRGASGVAAAGGDDYESYRRYCSRRLARLRRSRDVKKELSHGPAGGKSTGTAAAATAGAASAAEEPKQQFTSKKKGKKGKGKGGGGRQHLPGAGRQEGRREIRLPSPTSSRPLRRDAARALLPRVAVLGRAVLVSCHGDQGSVRRCRAGSEARCWQEEEEDEVGRWRQDGINDAGGSKKKASPAQIRRHYINKLHKASTYGAELEERVKVSCDDRTAIEARAYAACMRGTLALEVGNWRVRTFGMLAEL